MKWYLVVGLSLFITACASRPQMRGDPVVSLAGDMISDLKVTALVNQELSSEPYILVDVYLQNLNPTWLRAKNFEILEIEGAEQFKVISGPDLASWRKSMTLDFELRGEETMNEGEKTKLKEKKTKLAGYADEDHLYRAFALPSGLQAHKWIVFQLEPTEKLKGFRFEITWLDDRKQVFRAHLAKELP